ncbi:MAG: DUF1289 domain-containing protein [Stenotrophobium sp.]
MSSGKDIASPCIQVCRLDAAQVCEGCGRSLAEIAEWPQATDARKLRILEFSQLRLQIQASDHERHQAR